MKPQARQPGRPRAIWAAACAAGALLWACNLSESARETLLSLKLDDSLAAYDSIRVDILYPSGMPYKEAVFHGRYVPDADHALDGLDLGARPPSHYQVLITAYRGGSLALVYGVKVGPSGAEPPKVLVREPPADTGKGPAGETLPLRVAFLTPSPLGLAIGGQAVQAKAAVEPAGADPGLIWSSSDSAVARVDGGGMVFPLAAGEADIVARSRRDPSLSAALRVKVSEAKALGVSLAPQQAVLYLGGEQLRLEARVEPPEAHAVMAFASNDLAVAWVTPEGVVNATAPGETEVIAYPQGNPSLALACRITVKRDVPVLDLGGDRALGAGDSVAFPVRVVQEYGSVAVLKWDLEGDGIWEDSTTGDAAAPKHLYPTTGDSLMAAIFFVRDGEGNEARNFLFVRARADSVFISHP